MVDTDPQANATSGLGVDPATARDTMYDVFMGCIEGYPEKKISQIIIRTQSGIDLAPSTLDLVGVEPFLYPLENRYRILRSQLDSIRNNYDFILVDTPPSMGQFVINGLIAADKVIITFDRGVFSLQGLHAIEMIFQDIAEIIGSTVRADLAILTRWKGGSDTHHENGFIRMLKRWFPDVPGDEALEEERLLHEAEEIIKKEIPVVFTVPYSNLVYESQRQGLPLSHLYPDSEVALAYRKISDTVLSWSGAGPGIVDNKTGGTA